MEVTPGMTKQVIERQIYDWTVAKENLRIQHIVAQSLNDTEEQRKPIRDQMIRCELAIEKLNKMLAELDMPVSK